jgi:RNA polymerase sigma-70 factor (ECF subfamily)
MPLPGDGAPTRSPGRSNEAPRAGQSDPGRSGVGQPAPELAQLTERSDSELLAAHVAGDPDAFGVLFARNQQRMWAVAVRTLRNPDDAADAVQEAAISAFRHASSFRGDAAVTTWLHRIVVNACLDRLRRRAARPAESLPDDETSPSADRAVPDATESRQTQLDVRAALASLNPDQRAALVLVDLEGYSVEDAAAVLDCAVGTVKSRCARGRARLAVLLGHLGPSDGEGASGGNRVALRCVGLRSRHSSWAGAADQCVVGEVVW